MLINNNYFIIYFKVMDSNIMIIYMFIYSILLIYISSILFFHLLIILQRMSTRIIIINIYQYCNLYMNILGVTTK